MQKVLVSYALLALGALGALSFTVLLASGRLGSPAVALPAILPMAFYIAGGLAVWKQPGHVAAQRLLAVGALHLLAFALGAVTSTLPGTPLPVLWLLNFVSFTCYGVGFAALLALYAVFPDGLYWHRHEQLAVRAAASAAILFSLARLLGSPTQPSMFGPALASPTVANPYWVPALAPLASLYGVLFLAPVVGLVLLGLRYRRASPEQRLQMRWPLASALLLGVALLASGPVAALFGEVVQAVSFILVAAMLPATLVIGMLRHRLFDIDLVIRRSLVYGVLWLAIALTYMALAAILGLAAGQQFSVSVAVVTTIAAGMLFQPARRRLEGFADRLVFGERLSGYELMRQYGATLQNALDPREHAPRLAATVRRGLNAQWTRVALYYGRGGERRLCPEAASGIALNSADKAEVVVPLVHADETVGVVECGPKDEGDYTSADRDLLAALARQAALAIRNARLAAELADRLKEVERQARELAASRTRIVQAAEAERRRIERDLHDGVQQQLVALMARAAVARAQLTTNPTQADAALAQLQSTLQQAHADLRDLVRGIHPAVLSDRGLAEAVEARAAQLPIGVAIEAESWVARRRFDPEIEGAAYFLISEGLTNVMKHAAVDQASVRIGMAESRLVVEVADAGRGFDPQTIEPSGLGGLRDRLEALGGGLQVVTRPREGTRVIGTLPARECQHA